MVAVAVVVRVAAAVVVDSAAAVVVVAPAVVAVVSGVVAATATDPLQPGSAGLHLGAMPQAVPRCHFPISDKLGLPRFPELVSPISFWNSV